ncbi:MAG: hypothetical protein QNJ44_05980 [Rhodobacter sp.]|nr:hypothetical protein [Rhodobacter sp.]
MTMGLSVLLLLVLAVAVAAVLAHTRVSGFEHGIEARLNRAPDPRDVSGNLPEKVREFALRADATPNDLAVGFTFTQAAEMQLTPGQPWQSLRARQMIATGAAGFLWQASQFVGPVPKLHVVDGFADGAGALRVWLLGLIPVLRAESADIDRGEAMRYLAELPWAPDAILGNPDLSWQMVGEDWAEVSMDLADGPVAVRFRFDGSGDIVEVFAAGRPTSDAAGKRVLRDWQGYFRDYRMIGPRRIPAEAEIGYVEPGGMRPYFQGRIVDYSVTH